MSAPTISDTDRSMYPAVCGPCPIDPSECLASVRRICECTQRLLDQIDEIAEGLVSGAGHRS